MPTSHFVMDMVWQRKGCDRPSVDLMCDIIIERSEGLVGKKSFPSGLVSIDMKPAVLMQPRSPPGTSVSIADAFTFELQRLGRWCGFLQLSQTLPQALHDFFLLAKI